MGFLDYLDDKEKEIDAVEVKEVKKVSKKKVIKETKKPEYKVSVPKKTIPKKKVVEVVSTDPKERAAFILEGMADENEVNDETLKANVPEELKSSETTSHASMLL